VTNGRLALVLTAAAVLLAVPEAVSATRVAVPLDHSGAFPGRLVLKITRSEPFKGADPVTLVLPAAPGAPARIRGSGSS
jgi:hypothetical protein